MGGNAKHMPHIWEHFDATFNDVESLLGCLTTGDIIATEKWDGVNIHFRIDNQGVTRFSRNDTDLKAGGFTFLEALSLYQNHKAKDTFIEGCRAIDEHFSDTWWPFGFSGRNWVNAEIVNASRPQLLSYDVSAIVFHEVKTFLPGKQSLSEEKNQLKIPQLLPESPVVTSTNRKWEILGPTPVQLYDRSGAGFLSDAKNRLKKCLDATGLNSQNTIRDFLKASLLRGPVAELNTSQSVKEGLANKISGFPAPRLVDLKKNQPQGVADKISALGQKKNEAKVRRSALLPLINTLDSFGVHRLSDVESALIEDHDLEKSRIFNEINTAAYNIGSAADDRASDRVDMFNSLLSEWRAVGGEPAVVEGITFTFMGGKTKVTGGFSTLNQVLGVDRYGRAGIPATPLSPKDTTPTLVEWFGLVG
jgi:hypothetical protein